MQFFQVMEKNVLRAKLVMHTRLQDDLLDEIDRSSRRHMSRLLAVNLIERMKELIVNEWKIIIIIIIMNEYD